MSLTSYTHMKTEIVGIWEGNYREVVSLLFCKCREIHIRTQGKKLIVKDSRIDFYLCIPLGEPIEIPLYKELGYEESVDEDDDPVIMEEPLNETRQASISTEQEQLMRKWGLL